jgi:O-methyltransferase involved in polyketide biosynthesis
MMNLSKVSQTAILILVCRVVASQKKNPIFYDPMAVLSLQRLISVSSEEEKKLIIKWKKMYTGIQARDARARIQTVMKFDSITNLFISAHPGCTVINLACGFDTRFWRIENEKCKYIELDLPEVIELKREILKDHLGYEFIAASVLDPAWIDKVSSNGNSNFLLLAEGLFMYLPKQDVIRLLQGISRRFNHSQLVLDMAPEKYTHGLWKKMINLESRAWGLDVSIVSGITNPRDIESYGTGIKVMSAVKGSIGPIITVAMEN